jgi:hypothetical protein
MGMVRLLGWWPGWTSLWYRGELYGLLVAILFGTLLDIALLATLVWPEWLARWLVWSLWIGILIAASITFFRTLWGGAHPTVASPEPSDEALLALAQTDYLRGEYLEAEVSLHRILSSGREDIEAALLLASVLRRTGRTRQAGECLDRLERFDRAAVWCDEIARERRKCSVPAAVGEGESPDAS